MAFKFIALASLLAVASAGVIAPLGYAAASPAFGYAAQAAPLAYAAAPAYAKVAVNAEYDPNPQYSYGYSVQDALTGDNKHQEETRNGDVVKGSYSLVESDGTRRVVEYTADPINGFNAVVHKEPLHQKTIVAAAPAISYAAPAVAHYAAAPVAKLAYAAPAYSAYAAAPIAHGYAAPAYGHAIASPAYLG